jgi:hypothetical protein
MIEVNIDYNNLTAARKAKAELVKVKISNHPDFPPGAIWEIDLTKVQYDALIS